MSRLLRTLIAVGSAVSLATFGLTVSAGAISAMTPVTVQISADAAGNSCGGNWGLNYTDRIFTATLVSAGKWKVTTSDQGVWLAWPDMAAPLDTGCSTAMGARESGPLTGSATIVVTKAAGAPSAANMRSNLKAEGATTYLNGSIITVNGNVQGQSGTGGTSFIDLVKNLFPNPMGPGGVVASIKSYSWAYTFPPTGEVMVRSSSGSTDTPAGIFTNGG